LPESFGQYKIFKLPKKNSASGFPECPWMFGHKWNLLCGPQVIGQHKNPKMPKSFKH
jgi:hypothetical protein